VDGRPGAPYVLRCGHVTPDPRILAERLRVVERRSLGVYTHRV
jgi:hypothetical protein